MTPAMGDRSKDAPEVSEPEVLEEMDAEDVVVEEVDESAFVIPETPEALPAAGKDTALAPYDPLQRYLAEVRRYPFLTKEEELHLFNDFQATGNRESAVKLIVSNLRVSVAIAAEYLHSGADYLDLIQEGNVGLMQAIKKFDPAKGSRFHSYAAWWVRAYILRYLLNTYRMVKIGTTQSQRKLFYNLNKEKRKLEREGFAPDTKLLADRLNVREQDVIEMSQRLGSWDLSLDAPLGPDQEGTLLDVLPSQGMPADESLAHTELRDLFRKKLAEFAATLDDRYADILRNRILSETPLTLDDLGKKYSISRERARQLEEKIIKRLRDFMKKEIKDFEFLKP
ncbi:MAG: sigma-70 family RNA polymerase sigma factor [Nitrospiraceae bacterium]|nr:MAG: sigma-70 family RNA polymerase sigma factor [Nitrospiraceae bacterium]